MPNAQFFNPQNEAEAKRRMRMAKMLQEASQTPQSPAGTVVAQSPFAAIARGVAGGFGNLQEQQAEEAMRQDSIDRQKFLQSAVSQYGNDPKLLAQALLTQPSTADAGMSLYGDAIKGDQLSAYQAAMLGLQNRKIQAEYPIDPLTGAPKKEQKLSVRDEIELSKARDASQGASTIKNKAAEAESILKTYETSKSSPIVGMGGQIANAINMAGKETKQKVTDFESLNRISKELGVAALQQFGGNDTDKELKIAIETKLDPTATPETTLKNLRNQVAAANVLEQRPIFMEEWVQKNGGINRADRETGESFTSAWQKTQRQLYKEATQQKPAITPPQNDEEAAFLRSLDNAPQ